MSGDGRDQITRRIRELNDGFRQSLVGGRVVLTSGVQELGAEPISGLVRMVQTYSSEQFQPDSDPYGEHDFGSISYEGTKYFWKIDYYDRNLEFHSENAADPTVTQRVMTTMRADEY